MNHKGYLLFGNIFYNHKQIFSGMLSVWNNIAFAEKNVAKNSIYMKLYIKQYIYIYRKTTKIEDIMNLLNYETKHKEGF